MLFAKLDARITYAGRSYDLDTTRWHDGTVAPAGYANIETFALDGTVPVWTYRCADACIERRVWMDRGRNATYVTFAVHAAAQTLSFEADVFAVDRDYHATMRAFAAGDATTVDANHARIVLAAGTPWYLHVAGATIEAASGWYGGMALPLETERGLDDREDLYHAARLRAELRAGDSITLLATLEGAVEAGTSLALTSADARTPLATAASASRAALDDRAATLVKLARKRIAAASPAVRGWLPQLVLAADAFIVDRATAADRAGTADADGKTVIAGYPWFGDWGRDTMIALPGLTLATGRPEVARSILRTFARYVDRGMLPNRFPDVGEAPEYNTVDATLWFVLAIGAYAADTRDARLVRELFPTLLSIVDWHVRGTRYGIGVDAGDGLLRAGEAGVQLTWMDAKVGDWVVTPRIGKPVEINALWYNALRTIAALARRIGADPLPFDTLAGRAQTGFARFWNAERTYLFDVIDGPDGNDPSIRPNAIFAVSLPYRLLDPRRERALVERASRDLLTSFGLRSLAPGEPGYAPEYGGDPRARDGAYHNGTVWPWLAGAFIEAHFRVFADRAAVDALLAPFAGLLRGCAIGTLPEIADAAAPHAPRGCFAQAWSVAEMLRVATVLARERGT